MSINKTLPIFGSLFGPATLSGSILATGWSPAETDEVMADINRSPTLSAQLIDLSHKEWKIVYPAPNGGAYTDPQAKTIFLSKEYFTQQGSYDAAQTFIGVLSYEVGHAEDPQYNSIYYDGSDLEVGANVALDLFSEAKSVVNNVAAASEIASKALIPEEDPNYSPGNSTQSLLDDAGSVALEDTSTNGGGSLISYYWNLYLSEFLTSLTKTDTPQDLNALQSINVSYVTSVTFSQGSNNIYTMDMQFNSNSSISSYKIVFGNYGALLPSGTSGGFPILQPKSPSLGNSETYQQFKFKSGETLTVQNNSDNVSPTQIISTPAPNVSLVASGTLGGLEAGGSLNTLIDLSGSNSIFDGGTYSSLIEIAGNATTSVDNTFSFAGGTNVLIGDLGNNTFVQNPTIDSSSVNIIWGGGGTSTYELDGGVIDILYTQGTPTAQEIETLNTNLLEQTLPQIFYFDGPNSGTLLDYSANLYGEVTYIVNPTPNDVLVIPVSAFGMTAEAISASGTYSYGTNAPYGISTLDGGIPLYIDSNNEGGETPLQASSPYDGDVALGHVASGFIEDALVNFEDGDLGITVPDGGSYDGKKTIDVGSGNSGSSGGSSGAGNVGSGSSEYVPSGGTISGENVGSGGSVNVTAGGSTNDVTVSDGGEETIDFSGSTIETIVQSGGYEFVQTGGLANGSTVQNGGYEVVLSGGTSDGAIVSSGGHLVVVPGATINGTTLEAGGKVVSTGVIVVSATSVQLYASIANSLSLGSDIIEIVASGGTASGSEVGPNSKRRAEKRSAFRHLYGRSPIPVGISVRSGVPHAASYNPIATHL